MADPLSVAGLVASVVSLGIQLYHDLQTFVDAVKDRDEDIARLTRQAASMCQVLDSIERSLQYSNLINSGVVDYATVVPLLDASRQELSSLQQEVVSLTQTINRQKTSGVVGFAKASTQKLKYPRQRVNIEKLEDCLDQANRTLHLALSGLTPCTLSKLCSIKSDTDAVKSHSEVVVHGLRDVQKSLPDMEARVVTELFDKFKTLNQTVTQSIQEAGGNLNLAFVSLQADVRQVQQTQTKGVNEVKQLLQDLLLRMDANASVGHQDTILHRHLASAMSKPSALKTLCEGFSDDQSTDWFQSDRNIQPPCSCQHRRIAYSHTH